MFSRRECAYQAVHTETDREFAVDQGAKSRVLRQELRRRVSSRRATGWAQPEEGRYAPGLNIRRVGPCVRES